MVDRVTKHPTYEHHRGSVGGKVEEMGMGKEMLMLGRCLEVGILLLFLRMGVECRLRDLVEQLHQEGCVMGQVLGMEVLIHLVGDGLLMLTLGVLIQDFVCFSYI